VLLCGEEAKAQYLGSQLKDTTLDECRGYAYSVNGITYICTYHPQDCVDALDYEKTLNPEALDYVGGAGNDNAEKDGDSEDDFTTKGHGKTRRKNYKFWFGRDVLKAATICKEPALFNIAEPQRLIIPSLQSIIDWIEVELNAANGDPIFFDIESNPATQQLTCIGIGNYAGKVISIPIYQPGDSGELYYGLNGITEILRLLCKLFAVKKVVIHNSMFDLFIMLWKYKIPPPPQHNIIDTMLMWHRCYPEVEKSLGHLISTLSYTLPYHKNTAGTWTPHNMSQLRTLCEYNAQDVYSMSVIYPRLQAECEKLGAIESAKQACASVRPYLLLSYRGLKLDNERLCTDIDNSIKREEFFELNVLPRLVGHLLNPRSPKQVAKYLYEELGLKRPAKDPTNEKTLLKLLLKYNIPAVKVIIHMRGIRKERGQLSFMQWQNGRASCTYYISGTDTYRLGSRKILNEYGTNMQNWSKSMRDKIIPDKGCVFVQCDQSGAEALIVAYLAKAGLFRDLFLNNIKPHTFVALHIFTNELQAFTKIPLQQFLSLSPRDLKAHADWKQVAQLIKDTDDWEPNRRFYFIAKQVCHSSNYDIKAPTLCLNTLLKSDGQINLSVLQGNKFLDKYHGLFPEIRMFHNYVMQQWEQNGGIIRNLFGFPRVFLGNPHVNDSVKKAMYAFIPQSTVGSITNVAISNLQADLDSGKYNDTPFCVMQNNHDSILSQCAEAHKEKVMEINMAALNQELQSPVDGVKFRMKSEGGWGPNWAKAK